MPEYQTSGSAGVDIRAENIIAIYDGVNLINEETVDRVKENFEEKGFIKIRPFQRVLFGIGITVAFIPPGLEIQVRPRSGLSLKKGLMLSNSIGTIDSDYRGEIGVILYNSTKSLIKVERRERIAQMVVSEVKQVEFEVVNEIQESERGSGGFGSTGTN